MKTALLTAAVLLAILLAGGLAFIYSGRYSVAAAEPHGAVERWALETVKRASVSSGAEGLAVPHLEDDQRVRAGARPFAEMCATCHAAPGVEPSAIARGLNPVPPPPADLVQRWTPAELFWITKHGIRMTGMPAWGETHSDDEIWDVVAFLQRMPGMSPEEYKEAVAEAPDHHHDHDHGADRPGPGDSSEPSGDRQGGAERPRER